MKKKFYDIFSAARKKMLAGLSKRKVGKNFKGDITKYFDKCIEADVIAGLRKIIKFKAYIISEELKTKVVVNEKIEMQGKYIVVDPVDGSDNYMKSIPFVCFGISVFSEKFEPLYSAVGNYFTGDFLYADRKRLYFNNKKFKKKYKNTGAYEVLVALSGLRNRGGMLNSICKFSHIRSLGATIGEMIMVVKGEFDAFVDVRGRLTLENFAPFFLIGKYAGVKLTDEKGRTAVIKDFSLVRGYNIVFARESAARREIMAAISKNESG